MHILIIIALIAIIGFLIYNVFQGGKDKGSGAEAKVINVPPGKQLAYIASGKLFYVTSDGVEAIESKFVQEILDRAERKRERHAWKEGTSFAQPFAGGLGGGNSQQVEMNMSSVDIVAPGKLLYALHDNRVGGLFSYDVESNNERRLVHRQNLNIEDLTYSDTRELVLCSQRNATGGANICIMDSEGGEYEELTQGDTVDRCPAFVSAGNDIVFQSQGVARTEQGFAAGLGPATIEMLDRERGKLKTVVEDERYDHLQPRVDNQGNLLFIRRPYEAPAYKASNVITDFLFFPFRLARAVFHYLNFFSLMYSRKPLTSASGPEVQADMKDILVKGKRLDAETALRRGNDPDAPANLSKVVTF